MPRLSGTLRSLPAFTIPAPSEWARQAEHLASSAMRPIYIIVFDDFLQPSDMSRAAAAICKQLAASLPMSSQKLGTVQVQNRHLREPCSDGGHLVRLHLVRPVLLLRAYLHWRQRDARVCHNGQPLLHDGPSHRQFCLGERGILRLFHSAWGMDARCFMVCPMPCHAAPIVRQMPVLTRPCSACFHAGLLIHPFCTRLHSTA